MTDKPSCRMKSTSQATELDSLMTMGRGITHDCSNLITAIKGNIFMIKNSLDNKAIIDNSISQIEYCTDRALELLNKISTYTGSSPFNSQPLDINKLITATCSDLKEPHLTIPAVTFALKKSLPDINADYEQLQNLVECLLINSAEAMIEHDGEITITTGMIKKKDRKDIELTYPDQLAETDYIFIRVQDEGKGITAKIQKKMFTPFFTTKIRGEGLGLSTVIGVVKAHSGAMIVDSRAHKGSTFTVILPIS